MQCLSCGKETNNPKFCSRSCSATYTNKLQPKRATKKICTVCGERVLSYRHSKCKTHWEEFLDNKKLQYKYKTLGEYRNLQSVKGKGSSQVNSHIRLFARLWLKHLTKVPCVKCGYSKHVQLAHIRAVCDFSDDELLLDVNAESNVVPLCPNCHWEFDNLPREGFFFNLNPLSPHQSSKLIA